ncbi:MAG TPA: molybdopterin-dependent oxidoreductase [Pyrinomonadaceae bacterium]|jgi:NADH-quinone oxidoreductase subunit G|nr:molybdopterin-dependent oxidoreductase [Pyrinomonadaceae bacterium]
MATELVKITVNGQEFEVEKGAPLIDVCKEKGFMIPSFCYYSDLELQASCRMCLVRVEKMPKLQTSCTMTCTDGLNVTTESDEIEKAQRAMSEFLLANHPLDCPVCDRGGECELQEMVFDWGGLDERFSEKKNAYPEKYLSPIVANDQQRCILCKRCTRVCSEWMGEDAIEAGNRGVDTVIGTYGGWLNCSQCGNCIEVCPTGTLLDAVYRHETRPWELERTISTDTYGSDGMQLSIGSRGGLVHRIVARDRYVNGLNGEFLDIKSRFGHGFINHPDRIKTPLIRYTKGGKLIPASWDAAISFAAEKLKAASGSVGVVASARLTNESIYSLKRFAKEVLNSDDYAVSDAYDLSAFFDSMSAPLATHRQIRHAATILLIGGEPEEEQTFTAKQMRQAVKNGGAKLIIVNDTPIRLMSAATQFVHINPGSYDAFVSTFVGNGKSIDKLGIAQEEFDAVKQTIADTQGDLIIMFGGDISGGAQAMLANSAAGFAAEGRNVLLHPLPLYNNSVGANDIMNGKKPLADVLKNSKALYIAGSLSEENAALLAGKDFVVVQEMFETKTTAHADVILPAASFAEMDGTYTNNTGFVQRVRQAISPVNQSKPDWVATATLAKEMGVDFAYQMSASNVFAQLADNTPGYDGMRYPHLKDESRPMQVKHAIADKKDLSDEIKALDESTAALPEQAEKNTATPKVGHKLFRITTMTGKTEQFHLLASGNPKPENRLVSPLYTFNLDGTPKETQSEEQTVEAAA